MYEPTFDTLSKIEKSDLKLALELGTKTSYRRANTLHRVLGL